MRCILVCPDDFLWRLVADSGEPRLDPLYLVESGRARTRIAQRGGDVLTGDLERDGLYRRAFRMGHEPVLLAVERPRQARITAAIRRVAPEAPILVLAEDRVPGGEPEGVIPLDMEAVAERFVAPALERAVTRARVERVRAHFAPAERVLIMMQDDPDPDAIASALALRAVLGRNKTAAPIATFGTITRPENRAMTRILEIDVEQIKPRALEEYDMVAMVDAQPSFFEETFERVDLVIDHHPEESPVRAVLKDLRPGAVAYPELVAQFADFFLQVEGAEWSVVSGTVHGELHVSVRNVGWVRAAGDVVRHAFGDLGSAGGHRAMAKAVIRLRDWRTREGDASPEALARTIVARFTKALRT